MELGIVGLGRMGSNMARRLMKDGHAIFAYDVNPDAVKGLEGEGATGADSLADFVKEMTAPRAVWVMVPAGKITEETVEGLEGVLEAGDTIIDGGNSYYRDDMRRGKRAGEKGIDYIDCGTSGGVFGLERGYCLMIGGPDGAVETLLGGQGVCRDYAHVVVALLRALDVPTRLVAVYAPGLSPMDFHAVAEAFVEGGT